MQSRWLVISLLLIATVAYTADAADGDAEQATLSLSISLRHGPPVGQTPEEAAAEGAPVDTVFEHGEPIDVAFTGANEGETPFRYDDRNYDRSGRMDEYALEVTDEQERRLDDPRKLWGGAWPGGGASGRGEIGPGDSFTKHIYLNQWVMPLSPGRHTVVGVYYPDPWDRTPKQAAVRSGPVEIEVRARTEKDMEAHVTSLGVELQSTEPERRVQAVRYLGFTGSPHALPYVISSLYDDARNVAFRASEAFMYMAEKDASIEALLAALNQRGPSRAIQYLFDRYEVPKSQTLAPTVRGLSDADPVRRAAAAGALVRYYEMGEPALDPLLGALKDEDPQVRQAAAGALYNYRMPKATEALLGASEDPEESVREVAARVLGNIEAEAAIPRLRELLEDTPMVAKTAVHGLANIGTPEAVEALRTGLEVEQEEIRARAAIALIGLGDDSVRELIAKALEGGDWRLREMIRGSLGYAVERRGIPGPGPEGSPYTADADAWIKWLRL